MSAKPPRLVYDGICNLCIGAVRFLGLLDRHSLIQYSAFQMLEPRFRVRYGLRTEALQGRMHLIERDGSVLAGPDAIAEVCRLVTPFRGVCRLFSSLPARKLYEFVAQRRYRMFGCRCSCYTPSTWVTTQEP
ncbi:MAG TPA: DUF393 domain-containing protein [Candidatus Acidoferrales bacterium]|nr:DUF393 domain-containing protein [Candidatus Acidoferrales bacterium]